MTSSVTASDRLIASIPVGTPTRPGVYDSSTVTPKLKLGVFSSLYVSSISGGSTGTDTVSIELFLDTLLKAKLPDLHVTANHGGNSSKFSTVGFNRVVMTNPTNAIMTVEVRLGADAEFTYSGAGAGGVASNVRVIGTPSVAAQITNTATNPVITHLPHGVAAEIVNTTVDKAIYVKGDVGLSSGASLSINNTATNPVITHLPHGVAAEIVNTTVDKAIYVKGDVGLSSGTKIGLADGTKVKIDGAITVDATPTASDALASPTITLGVTAVKILSARTKRAGVTVQSSIANQLPVLILDPSAAHNVMVEVVPGGAWSEAYSGELWGKASVANQKITVYETFNS